MLIINEYIALLSLNVKVNSQHAVAFLEKITVSALMC